MAQQPPMIDYAPSVFHCLSRSDKTYAIDSTKSSPSGMAEFSNDGLRRISKSVTVVLEEVDVELLVEVLLLELVELEVDVDVLVAVVNAAACTATLSMLTWPAVSRPSKRKVTFWPAESELVRNEYAKSVQAPRVTSAAETSTAPSTSWK